jgi:integrase/recombinase XerC
MSNPDLDQLIEDFLEYLVSIRGYSDQTALTYETALNQMKGKCSLYQEKGGWILDIMPYRLDIRSLSKRSIHAKLTAIRSFLNYLNDHVGLNVTAKGTDTIKVPQTLPKPIEESAIEEVIADATPEEELLIAMLYGLGLRISELSSMRLEWISDEWIEVHGKGNKVRQLPILPYLQELISRHRQTNAPIKYLFEKDSDPLNAAQLRYRLTKLFRSHGFKVTPHQLRHSFATHLLTHGARIADVSELLGHASMATTQVYTKLGSVKKMDEYMQAHPLAGNRGS